MVEIVPSPSRGRNRNAAHSYSAFKRFLIVSTRIAQKRIDEVKRGKEIRAGAHR